MEKKFKKNHGFTLLEIIIVLSILGILTAIAASHIGDSQADLITSTDTMKSHLRYVQSMSMNSAEDTIWGIRFIKYSKNAVYYPFSVTTATEKTQPWAEATRRILPGSSPETDKLHQLVEGVKIDSTDGFFKFPSDSTNGPPVDCVYFDKQGVPYRDSQVTFATKISQNLVISFSDTKKPDNSPKTITISYESGYIQ